MADILSTEFLITFSVLLMSILSVLGSAFAMRAAQQTSHRRRPTNLDKVVESAPYHRLHNIITMRRP